MSHLREEHVAGVLDAVDHIERSMLSRVDPAAQRRCDLLVDTGTVHRIIQPDHAFLKSRHRDDRLEGRSRRLLCLCGIVKERQGLIVI